MAFRDHPHRKAESGSHGSGKGKHGHSGTDLVIAVPEGTSIYDFDGSLLADLVHAGDRWLAAEGGRGGRGNARFLSNRRRAPSFANWFRSICCCWRSPDEIRFRTCATLAN